MCSYPFPQRVAVATLTATLFAVLSLPAATVKHLIISNSYSHYYEYIDDIAASLGDTYIFTTVRGTSYADEMIINARAIEAGTLTPPSYSWALAETNASILSDNGWYRLETDYDDRILFYPDALDEQEWDFISSQSHSSSMVDIAQNGGRMSEFHDYFVVEGHEPSATLLWYQSTPYRNDAHIFRSLGYNHGAQQSAYINGSVFYSQDDQCFGAMEVNDYVLDNFGMGIVPGGTAQMNLVYDKRWAPRLPDLSHDYFGVGLTEEPHVPANRYLHWKWHWLDAPEEYYPLGWNLDCHPSRIMNFLTACLWYEVLFDKDVRNSSYIPTGINLDADTATLIREVAHRTRLGLLPPLRLPYQPDRTDYGDKLWTAAQAQILDADPEVVAVGYDNLTTLYAYFPEHAQAAAAGTLLNGQGLLAEADALKRKEQAERPVREAIYQEIWDACTVLQGDLAAARPGDITGPDADADRDGVLNQVEALMGLSPFMFDENPTQSIDVEVGPSDAWLVLTHRRNTLRDDLSATLQQSADLSLWEDVPQDSNYLESVLDADLDGTGYLQRVEQRVRLTAPGTFFRINAK